MVAMSRWNMMVPCQRICVPTMRSDSLSGAVRTVEMEKIHRVQWGHVVLLEIDALFSSFRPQVPLGRSATITLARMVCTSHSPRLIQHCLVVVF